MLTLSKAWELFRETKESLWKENSMLDLRSCGFDQRGVNGQTISLKSTIPILSILLDSCNQESF